jgi:hypothetical protein
MPALGQPPVRRADLLVAGEVRDAERRVVVRLARGQRWQLRRVFALLRYLGV